MSGSDFTTIISQRVLLRRFKPSDLPVFHAYRNDPQVAEYQGWEALYMEAGAKDIIGAGLGEKACVA